MVSERGSGPLRVLVCDDALGFPALVASWLDGAPGVEHAGTTTTATELLEVIADRAPDVVLLDLMLPEGPASPELVRSIRELAPGSRVILVSSLPAALLEAEVQRIGADDACPKATTAERLLAIVTVDAA
jgi:DNA-binding NarL/FixJ family response regulator